jgi:hypothetical protein
MLSLAGIVSVCYVSLTDAIPCRDSIRMFSLTDAIIICTAYQKRLAPISYQILVVFFLGKILLHFRY